MQAILDRNEIRVNLKAIDAEVEALERSAAEQQRQTEQTARAEQGARPGEAARNHGKAQPVRKALRVVDRATGMVSGVADFVTSLLAGSSPRPEPRRFDMKTFVSDPEARAAQRRADAAALREAEEAKIALENIRRDVEAGGDLSATDLANLTREQQEQIKAQGDDGVKQLIEDAHQRYERQRQGDGRERER